MRNLAVAAMGCVLGCVTPRYSAQQVEEITYCPGVGLEVARMNLAKSGYQITAAEEGYIQTGFMQIASSSPTASALAGQSATASVRFVVTPEGNGVRWKAFQKVVSTSVRRGALLGSSEQEKEVDMAAMAVQEGRYAIEMREAVCADGTVPALN